MYQRVHSTEHYKARQALQDALGDIDFEVDEVQFIPQTTTTLDAVDQPGAGQVTGPAQLPG